MNSYYQSLLNEIKRQIEEEKYSSALEMIQQELSMPYIPLDAETALKEYLEDCKSHMDTPLYSPDEEKIFSRINGTEEQMETVVTYLTGLNLRRYHTEVQKLLDSDLLGEFKGELIEALMEQSIDETYRINKDGLEITFVPSALVKKEEDPTLIEVHEIFDEWFASDNPSFCSFCERLLEQEMLERRPFDFTDEDALGIAKSIVRLVMEAFGQEDQWKLFEKIKGLEYITDVPLSIESRGKEHGN